MFVFWSLPGREIKKMIASHAWETTSNMSTSARAGICNAIRQLHLYYVVHFSTSDPLECEPISYHFHIGHFVFDFMTLYGKRMLHVRLCRNQESIYSLIA